jgi:hypothetical protein
MEEERKQGLPSEKSIGHFSVLILIPGRDFIRTRKGKETRKDEGSESRGNRKVIRSNF